MNNSIRPWDVSLFYHIGDRVTINGKLYELKKTKDPYNMIESLQFVQIKEGD